MTIIVRMVVVITTMAATPSEMATHYLTRWPRSVLLLTQTSLETVKLICGRHPCEIDKEAELAKCGDYNYNDTSINSDIVIESVARTPHSQKR